MPQIDKHDEYMSSLYLMNCQLVDLVDNLAYSSMVRNLAKEGIKGIHILASMIQREAYEMNHKWKKWPPD